MMICLKEVSKISPIEDKSEIEQGGRLELKKKYLKLMHKKAQ
jgi:hypothetical protein